MKRICIDPGHPSYFRNSKKINWGCEHGGIREVELNLKLARILKFFLEAQKFKVILTRDNSKKVVSNQERARIAKKFKADLFLRIHADSEKHDDKIIRGVKTIYPALVAKYISEKSYEVALIVHKEIIQMTNLVDRGVCDERICDLSDKLGMLQATKLANKYKIPTILIETVYLSNPEDREWILKLKNQKLMMLAIAKSLEKYF